MVWVNVQPCQMYCFWDTVYNGQTLCASYVKFCGCLKLIYACQCDLMNWCCRSYWWTYTWTAIRYNWPKQHGSYTHDRSVLKNMQCVYRMWRYIYKYNVFRRLSVLLLIFVVFVKLICLWDYLYYICFFAFWTCFSNGFNYHKFTIVVLDTCHLVWLLRKRTSNVHFVFGQMVVFHLFLIQFHMLLLLLKHLVKTFVVRLMKESEIYNKLTHCYNKR